MIKYTLLLLYIRFRSPEIHHKLREVLRRCAHFAMAINDKLVDWADIGHFHTVYVWCEWINNRTFPIHIIIISITFLFYCFVNDNSDMGVRQSSNNVCGHSVMKNNLLHVYCTSFASQTPCNNRLYSLIYTDRDMRIVQEIATLLNPYKPGVPFFGTQANSANPDQTPQNTASHQGLHCLLT